MVSSTINLLTQQKINPVIRGIVITLYNEKYEKAAWPENPGITGVLQSIIPDQP